MRLPTERRLPTLPVLRLPTGPVLRPLRVIRSPRLRPKRPRPRLLPITRLPLRPIPRLTLRAVTRLTLLASARLLGGP